MEKRDALDGSATLVAPASTADLQGRLVADVIAGMDVSDRNHRDGLVVHCPDTPPPVHER